MQQVVYVASPGSQQIQVWSLVQGTLQLLQIVESPHQVQPLVISPDGRWLYACIRPEFAVVSYQIAADGRLSEQGSAPMAGSASHTNTDPQGRFFLAASFAFNQVSVSAMDALGRVQVPHQYLDLTSAHSVTMLAGGDSPQLLVPSLQEDRIYRFTLNKQGVLAPHPQGSIDTARGAGPRHMACHPDNGDIYCLNELHCSVNRYHRAADDLIEECQSLDMMPAGYQGIRWGADIHITPNGRFLYASDRTSSLLSLFRVDPQDGSLTLQTHIAVETQPRSFAIDGSGHFLILAGEQSHHLALYGIDQQTGALTLISRQPVGLKPMWVRVAPCPTA